MSARARGEIRNRLLGASSFAAMLVVWVALTGSGPDGVPLRLEWHITAGKHNGPEIPCMAAILLARRIARGDGPAAGAHTAAGLLPLAEFAPEFERWGMVTQLEEGRAGDGA